MKPFYLCLVCCFMICSSCDRNAEVVKSLNAKLDSLQDVADSQWGLIESLRDTVRSLSFPSDQRLIKIKSLIAEDCFADAKNEISDLETLFPNSKEAKEAQSLRYSISAKEEAIRAEQERIQALGFKAIKAKTSFQIDYNNIILSNISIGKQFSYDSYGDYYFVSTADRGNRYVTASMSVTSSSTNPKLPQFAIYSIYGKQMKYQGRFTTKFARWEDYGTYLGNYHDNGNDFAKVSTVKFKIGVEVSTWVALDPFAIVVKKSNELELAYDRYSDPPMSYEGSVDYPDTLTMSNFEESYILVKLYNLK